MSNEMITQLPTVANAQLSDIIYAVQGNVSVQETLQQVSTLMLSQTVTSYAGNPNGNLAGNLDQLCWDTTDSRLYICTTAGTSASAVWTLIISALVTPAQGGTGVASPTAHTIPIAEGASNYTFLTLTNGQILIGSTGANPVPATITAGTNIAITNTAGAITIAASGAGGFSWTNVTGTTQNMTSNNGYVSNNAGRVILTLPSVSAFGDELGIVGFGNGGWQIAQGTGQQIHIGSGVTTAGTGGSLASTNQFDSLYMVCTVANSTWCCEGGIQGVITVV